MKLLLTIGFTLLFTTATYSTSTFEQPVQWQEIYAWNFAGSRGFVDEGSRIRISTDTNIDYSSATILIVYNDPVSVLLSGKKVTAKSLAKTIDIDCKTGFSQTISDFFYAEELPNNIHKPVAKKDYDNTSADLIRVPKSSLLYKTLCPRSV